MNQKEVVKKLIERSWTDSRFKAEFIANPVAVIERETGKKIDLKGKEIVVMDQSDANTYYLNLSRYVNNLGFANKELSDEQLEAVAGGRKSTSGGLCGDFINKPEKFWDQWKAKS